MQNLQETHDDPTFAEFLDDVGKVPSSEQAGEIIDHLRETMFADGVTDYEYLDGAFTYRRLKSYEIERTEIRRHSTYARIEAPIGRQKFWHPLVAPVPVIAIEMTYAEGYSKNWSEIVHPRLVAAGRDAVTERAAFWLYHELQMSAETLIRALSFLLFFRETETLDTAWPLDMPTKPGDEWDADPDDRVLWIGDEPEGKTAAERFPERFERRQ